MQNIEQYLHLFTSVKDGLPEDNGNYFCKVKGLKQAWTCRYVAESNWESSEVSSDSVKVEVTHWLSLQKINEMLFNPEIHTTKDKAVDLAEDAYLKGRGSNILRNNESFDYMHEFLSKRYREL